MEFLGFGPYNYNYYSRECLGYYVGNRGHYVKQGILDSSIVKKFINANSVPEAWQTMRDITRWHGFDNLIYGTNRLCGSGGFGEKTDTFFISDLPDSVLVPLWHEDGYRFAPIAVWAIRNQGAKSLSYGCEIEKKRKLTAKQEQTLRILGETGIKSGYVIGFNHRGKAAVSAMAMLSFDRTHAQTEALWAQHGAEIEACANLFQLRVDSLPLPTTTRRLTKRQSEVLKWVGVGKTTAEIATILGLSAATIEKHLRQVRDTLGVSTTTQAVLHAQINHQIFSTLE